MRSCVCLDSVEATQAAVVSVVLVRLGVPSVLVAGGEVQVGVGTRLVHEVSVVHRPPRQPLVGPSLLIPVQNILWIEKKYFKFQKIFDLPLSPDPVVARLARGAVVVVLGHGGPHTLHLVPVLDVGEGEHLLEAGEGLALLPPEAEVPAPGDALAEVHDLHVGPREHARVARRQPPVGAACVLGQALMEICL